MWTKKKRKKKKEKKPPEMLIETGRTSQSGRLYARTSHTEILEISFFFFFNEYLEIS